MNCIGKRTSREWDDDETLERQSVRMICRLVQKRLREDYDEDVQTKRVNFSWNGSKGFGNPGGEQNAWKEYCIRQRCAYEQQLTARETHRKMRECEEQRKCKEIPELLYWRSNRILRMAEAERRIRGGLHLMSLVSETHFHTHS